MSTDTPLALRFAELLDDSSLTVHHKAAAELRRLHAENESLKQANDAAYSAGLVEGERLAIADEALMRQALEALVINGSLGLTPAIRDAITALRERLGEQT